VRPGLVLSCILLAASVTRPTDVVAQHVHTQAPARSADDGSPVGKIEFPNSGSSSAQPYFLRGVALLHTFSYDRARTAFQKAERIDPNFALAYWGEALSDRWPQGLSEDTVAALAALNRLAPTTAARAAKAHTARERAYLAAVETLFGMNTLPGDSQIAGNSGLRLRIDSARITRYTEMMRALHDAYPDDDEAAAFYAHALMNRRNLEWKDPDQFFRTSIAMAAAVEGVFARNPKHPGAAHFLIHAYDDARLAPLGVRAARAFAAIAPAEAHAQHMPSHIFIRYGQWDDVVSSNERAWAISRKDAGTGSDAPLEYDWHNASFLQYGYLQQGRWHEAKRLADSANALLAADRISRAKPNEKQMLIGFLSQFAELYAGETRQYQLTALNGTLDYPNAFARRDAALLDSIEKRLEIAPVTADMSASSIREQLRQTRHFKDAVAGRPDSAIVMFQRWCRSDLTDAQSAMSEGARSYGETACETAAGLLAERGRFADAVSAYDDALKFVPGHWIARLERARALACLGDKPRARTAYAELLVQWKHADSDLPDLAEVKSGADGLASSPRNSKPCNTPATASR
jgi:tetratricopeptide (TPR) repeat protein